MILGLSPNTKFLCTIEISGSFRDLRMGRLVQTDVGQSEGGILDDDVFVVAVVVQQVDDGVDGEVLALGERSSA
jgi:hypothetical protein